MSNDLSVNMRRAELDRQYEERRRRMLAAREAMKAQTITVPRPHVEFGPKGVPLNDSDADYLREAARNIEHSGCLGSNLTTTVKALLLDAARAIEASTAPELAGVVGQEGESRG